MIRWCRKLWKKARKVEQNLPDTMRWFESYDMPIYVLLKSEYDKAEAGTEIPVRPVTPDDYNHLDELIWITFDADHRVIKVYKPEGVPEDYPELPKPIRGERGEKTRRP